MSPVRAQVFPSSSPVARPTVGAQAVSLCDTPQRRQQAQSFIRGQQTSRQDSSQTARASTKEEQSWENPEPLSTQHPEQEQASTTRDWLPVSAAALIPLLLGGPAYAAYSRIETEQLLKNVAGGAYVLLVCIFFFRLFRKRAQSGTSQSLRSQAEDAQRFDISSDSAPQDEEKEATPLAALGGAVQAGVLCFLLFQVCGLVDGYFDRQELPEQYTAHNITVTLRTVVRGLAYLMTFLFGANCVGLSGLAVQLLFFPDAGKKKPGDVEKTEQ